jgi:bifunctional non-homologous end joining protein LigD
MAQPTTLRLKASSTTARDRNTAQVGTAPTATDREGREGGPVERAIGRKHLVVGLDGEELVGGYSLTRMGTREARAVAARQGEARGGRRAAANSRSVRVGRWTLEVSNADRVLFPDDGITEGDLAEYYAAVSGAMLPHVRGRPVAMERYPDGLGRPGFLHKDVRRWRLPPWVKTAEVAKEQGRLTQVICSDARTLVWLADQACITPHVWLSRVDRPDRPDQLIFDLDPPDGFEAARRAALDLRSLLEELGLSALVKTTGGRGLHVVVVLDRRADFDAVRAFARRVAEVLADRAPDRVTTEQRRARRGHRVYLDVMRNAYAQHAVAPYAVRARAGAPVATPLDWSEVEDRRLDPGRFTIRTMPRRLERDGDPWARLGRGRSLDAPSRRLEALGRGRGAG